MQFLQSSKWRMAHPLRAFFTQTGNLLVQEITQLSYRFYEISYVYGGAIKECIHEQFGDGIMSAIDFTCDVTKEEDPKEIGSW